MKKKSTVQKAADDDNQKNVSANHGYEPKSKLRGILPSAARDCSTYQSRRAAHTVLEFHNEYQTEAYTQFKYTTATIPYIAAIFLGAFLLFLVQPMIGKYILPWFGGLPAVWTTCMLFFQVALLIGYGYAHWTSIFLQPRNQAIVHVIILLCCLAFLPIIPTDSWKPLGFESPLPRILALLVVTLGLPYLLLSSTGPLLQSWFTLQLPGLSPYRLYALSNLGSLLALICYPFLIEPNLTLHSQFYLWSGLFIIYTALCSWCAWGNRNHGLESATVKNTGKSENISGRQIFLWVTLACFPSALLLATTNQLTEELSVVPALWIGPLTIYLLSFIICFNKDSWYNRKIWLIALPFFLALTAAMLADLLSKRIWLQLPVYWGTLFVCCMACHGELSRLKPHPSWLTAYYLLIALGGAIGGAIVTLIAPAVFRGLWEYPLALAACCIILLTNFFMSREKLPHTIFLTTLISLIIIGVTAGYSILSQRQYVITTKRSFYGIIRIDRGNHADPLLDARIMLSGRIIHGYQYTKENLRRFPTAYYTDDSGIGLAMHVFWDRRDAYGKHVPIRAGIVGLGVGVLAAYGTSGDYYRFYEINPNVIRLADEYFTYLRDAKAGKEVILGDARLSMERESKSGDIGNFDILVLDAFTGDAIPLHLLTRESFNLYFAHLKKDGVLAINISNDHLDLRRLIYGLAQDSGHEAIHISNGRKGLDSMPSDWILVSHNKQFLSAPQLVKRINGWPQEVVNKPLIFTDDYSNLFRLLR